MEGRRIQTGKDLGTSPTAVHGDSFNDCYKPLQVVI